MASVTQRLAAAIDGHAIPRNAAPADLTPLQGRRHDSLLNGALIGAATAIASGLFLCTRTEPWRNCRDDVGPMVRIGALGAGIGIVIDALIRGREEGAAANPPPAAVFISPMAGRRGAGLHLAVRF
jgi:hypothetical protein